MRMSIKGEINQFFNKYGDKFDLEIINYTKQVVHNIQTSPTLTSFIKENKITSQLLLNEITPYSQYKFSEFGDEKLDMNELQAILNIILFSNEIENMILENHVSFSSIGENGVLNYISDDEASNYFNEKYGLDMEAGEEFDFTILEDKDDPDDLNNHGNFGLN